MMKTRTPTQIKELKNANLNTKFAFLTRDYSQITTTNPPESATSPFLVEQVFRNLKCGGQVIPCEESAVFKVFL